MNPLMRALPAGRAHRRVRGKRGTNGTDRHAAMPVDPRPSCSLAADESVPPAVEAFLTGTSFRDVLMRALARGNDVDTIAAHPDNLRLCRLIERL